MPLLEEYFLPLNDFIKGGVIPKEQLCTAQKLVADAVARALTSLPLILQFEISAALNAIEPQKNPGALGGIGYPAFNPYLRSPQGFQRTLLGTTIKKLVEESHPAVQCKIQYGISAGIDRANWQNNLYYDNEQRMKEYLRSTLTLVEVTYRCALPPVKMRKP